MAKRPTISTIATGYYSREALNNNFSNIQAAFDNTLSLDGSFPNAMSGDIDMNGNNFLNVGSLDANSFTINGTAINNPASILSWEGSWVTATDYVAYDVVSQNGNSYICLVDHTSGTFATDLSASKWGLLAQAGASGGGSGDLVASNNLSDVADAATALSNLGGQTQDDILDDLSGLTQAANKIPYFDSATTASVLDFKDEDDMVSNSATAVPSQQSVKAYVDANSSPIKAWVNFYGISGVTVNASSNVSSVVRNSTGDYTVTFSSALADQYFSAVITPGQGTASAVAPRIVSQTSSTVRFQTFQTGSGGAQDCGILNVIVAR